MSVFSGMLPADVVRRLDKMETSLDRLVELFEELLAIERARDEVNAVQTEAEIIAHIERIDARLKELHP